MELIYLWIEEYKNIKRQGFNFSSRFMCEFNPSKSELSVTKNSEYTSVFPKDISVTAIIGENGAGKSRVLNSLLTTFTECRSSYLNDKEEFKYFLVYRIDDELYKIGNIVIDFLGYPVKDNEDLDANFFKENDDTFSILLNNEVQKKSPFFESISFFCEQMKVMFPPYITSSKRVLLFLENLLFDRIRNEEYFDNRFEVNEIIIKFNGDLYLPYSAVSNDIDFYNEEGQRYIRKSMSELKKLKFAQKLEKIKELYDFKFKEHTAENSIFDLTEKKKRMEFNKYKLPDNFIELIPKIIRESESTVSEFKINIIDFNVSMYKFLKNLPEDVISIEIINSSNIFFSNLSFGERQMLVHLNMIINAIYKKEYKVYHPEYRFDDDTVRPESTTQHKINNMIILIDELELGLHPEWQRKIINYFVEVFKRLDKSIHLIITSHSPFLLSDLPKENVIFLEKEKQTNNCLNITDKVDINPFGANIHTLLSHGFFMKDGLMGEFAKDKIDDVIKYLKGGDSEINNDDEAQSIINIIGEPILQRHLQKMLTTKLESSNRNEIEALKARIIQLENGLGNN